MKIFSRRMWGRAVSTALIVSVCFLAVLLNVHVTEAKASHLSTSQNSYYPEVYKVKNRNGTYQFDVHELPTYSYIASKQEAIININQIDVYDSSNHFLWSFHGVMSEGVGANGHRFSQDALYSSGPYNPGNIEQYTPEWTPPFDPASASGCSVKPRTEYEAFWGDEYSQESCSNGASYDVNADNFAGNHVVATGPEFPADGVFQNAVRNERNQIDNIINNAPRVHTQYPPSISHKVVPNVINVAGQIALVIVGGLLLMGGTALNQWCINSTAPQNQCLGKATSRLTWLGGIAAALGGVILAASGIGVVTDGVVNASTAIAAAASALTSRLVAYFAAIDAGAAYATLQAYAAQIGASCLVAV